MSFVENRTGSKTKRLVSLLQKGMLLLVTVGTLVTIFDLSTFKGLRSEHLQIANESHRWKRLSDTCSGKEPLLELVTQAVGNISMAQAYNQDNCRALPTWNGVSNLYGPTPVILGLEHCEEFRSNLNQAKPLGGLKIAGFFNSGTNAMARTLMENLNDGKYGSRATLESTIRAQGVVTQVPWGKHRWILADELARLSQPDILPVVVVRDPYRWMQSMCKSKYTLVWDRGLANHCPNLVPSNNREMEMNGNRSSFSVQLTQSVTSTHHSLASLWSSWYGSYFRSSSPRLVVRMEDLVFHGPELVRRLSDCVGIDRVQPFVFLTEAAKDHGRSTDLLTAIVKYGRSEGRYSGMMVQDLVYARDALSADLMEALHYQYDSV